MTALYAEFYSRMQLVRETLAQFSRALIRLHQRIEGAASTVAERQALAVLGDGALKHQFVVGVRDELVRHELRRLMLRSGDKPFIVVREEALCLMCEEEVRVMELRPVEKAAPATSGPVSSSVSYVLGLDDVVLGDGRVSSGVVSGGLYDLDRVSGGGDTDVSGVDTVVSGADDIDSVSRDDIVVSVDEMSLSGGVDTVVSGVDEPVCCVSSVMTAGELDVSGCDILLSDETGDVV